VATPTLGSVYRTAFVTGASAGLGRAFAEMLLAEGVRVWGTARDAERLAPLGAHGAFRISILDLHDSEGAASAYARAAREADGFDLVINNAGYGLFAPFASQHFSQWQRQLDSLVTTTARLSHAALRDMLARDRGCLVNVSSLAVEFPLPFMSGYNVAKAALAALSESLIFETRGRPVTVIDFRPGDYRTTFNQAMHTTAVQNGPDQRLSSAWAVLEKNLRSAPAPTRAARDLRRALLRGRSGTVRSGSFFQATLAPLLSRLTPAVIRRAVAARYFGAA
jgi:uncharacterized protein